MDEKQPASKRIVPRSADRPAEAALDAAMSAIGRAYEKQRQRHEAMASAVQRMSRKPIAKLSPSVFEPPALGCSALRVFEDLEPVETRIARAMRDVLSEIKGESEPSLTPGETTNASRRHVTMLLFEPLFGNKKWEVEILSGDSQECRKVSKERMLYLEELAQARSLVLQKREASRGRLLRLKAWLAELGIQTALSTEAEAYRLVLKTRLRVRHAQGTRHRTTEAKRILRDEKRRRHGVR